ncbi:MAG: AI-2E family transporter [Candidatus Woesebacteria bacterium]|jgi:predicted PurR-regulated permease PerM
MPPRLLVVAHLAHHCHNLTKELKVNVKIEIDIKSFVRMLLVACAFVVGIFVLWKITPILLIIAVSFFLAIALNKPVSSLSRKMPRQSRIGATAVSYVIFIAVISLFLSLAVPPVVKQTTVFIDSMPEYIATVTEKKGIVSEIIDRYQLQDEVDSFVVGIQNQAGSLAQGVGTNVVAGVSNVINGFFTVFTVLVLTFLMLIEGPRWKEKLWESYTSKKLLKRHQALVGRMYRVVTGYVNGQVLVATIAGLCAALTLFILTLIFTVPSTAVLPLAATIMIAGLIPMIGATIGAIIVVTVLLFSDFGAAITFLIYFLIYQQIENNVIQPTVQAKTVELSALMVFIAALCGIMLFGLVGGILAIPVAGCIRVLALDYVHHRHREIKAKASA